MAGKRNIEDNEEKKMRNRTKNREKRRKEAW